MVRDNLDQTVQQNHAAETQRRGQRDAEDRDDPERSTDTVKADSQEPTDSQLDFLLWSKLRLEQQPDAWHQLVTTGDAGKFPSHLRPFSSPAEYELVKSTYQQLQHSGYYWGPMTMEEAHKILSPTLLGTFLIRDSCQPNVFFTLSYQSEDGPTSVRVQINKLLFSLHGSQRNFPSFFTLLTYYTSSSCKLTVPYRRQRPESLKQACRRVFIRSYGAENLSNLPGLSLPVKNYVHAYPHCI